MMNEININFTEEELTYLRRVLIGQTSKEIQKDVLEKVDLAFQDIR